MDIVERLTLEAAEADTVLASEHRHRYAFAAELCAGTRVLDLCCGSGYGTAILAAQAKEVVGVDRDAATIDTAQATIGRELHNASFELADAVPYLEGELPARYDAIVCFEGLEHLAALDRALELLRAHTMRGVRLIASVPNGKLFGEQNPFHVTEFGYEEAMGAFAGFPSPIMVPQFLAEGSLIVPQGASEAAVTVTVGDGAEPEYANHFLFCVNFDPSQVEAVHHGKINVSAAPIFNRWSEGLKHANRTLRRENARLARERLGKSGSGAAAALVRLADQEAELSALRERYRIAEERIRELEASRRTDATDPAGPEVQPWPGIGSQPPVEDSERQLDGDPNSWEQRRRRAAEYLVPWIEQTIPLAGKTVLEYGCGNAAVSCAFAERAQRLIGVDIDPRWIELGNDEVRKRGLENVELELHPVESIIDAVGARRGEIDVFLCYAVLEHLTLSERLAVLRLAREVVKSDGAIVVCETPNRLIYFDHHTAQMPFFHMLPDELAVDYYGRSSRADFRQSIDEAAGQGREEALQAIVRWGRGVSFHEFEVVFGDLARHVIASNYDPILFPERPVHPDEVILARYLERWRGDLAPVWSRYWLDVILSPQPVEQRPPLLRPWSAQTSASRGVGWTTTESMYLPSAEATLWVTLPHPTARLVVGTVSNAEQLRLLARGESMREPLERLAAGPPGSQVFTTFALPEPAHRVALDAGDACEIVFVGYED
jgi:2-polyprenyl-3-methyl-5-hydroxy-6-metoxy-1,4-benzoquinol methylase